MTLSKDLPPNSKLKEIASIDIGSNTVRLLILQVAKDGTVQQTDSLRRITRLGEGMDTQKRLSPKRMEDTLDTLCEFRDKCAVHGEIPIHAVATSAVREAENRDEFLQLAKQRTGIDIEVIPWEKEAELTLAGVFWKLPLQDKKILVFDIGGGSTEFILSQGKNIDSVCGTSLGVVRLTEKFISGHPVDPCEYAALVSHIQIELNRVRDELSAFSPEVVIGTAGTVTTLAALDMNMFPYDPEKIHGTVLPMDRIRELQNQLKGMSLAERLKWRALEKGREDLIIAGTALVLQTLLAFDCEFLTISEYSLREGLILKAMSEHSVG
jgi:exopolyphosphatase/guanosine-5'-triphosphate,3'-diphosphate pyrophosphatase